MHGSCIYRKRAQYVLRARFSIHTSRCSDQHRCCVAPFSFMRSLSLSLCLFFTLNSMRRYHLKFNSIKCSIGSTFYSIYLANCVYALERSQNAWKKKKEQTVILSLDASFAPLFVSLCCKCVSSFALCLRLHLIVLLLVLFIIANIFFGSFSQPIPKRCVASNADCERQHIELCSMDGYFFSLPLSHSLSLCTLVMSCFCVAAGCSLCTIWTSCEHCFNFDVTETSYAYRGVCQCIEPQHARIHEVKKKKSTQKNEWKYGKRERERSVLNCKHTKRILFANLSNLQEFAFSSVCFFCSSVYFVRFFILFLLYDVQRVFFLSLSAVCISIGVSECVLLKLLVQCFHFIPVSILMIAPKMVNLNYLLIQTINI